MLDNTSPVSGRHEPAWTSVTFLLLFVVLILLDFLCFTMRGWCQSSPRWNALEGNGQHGWLNSASSHGDEQIDPTMSNGRDPQSSFLHCNIRGRWSWAELSWWEEIEGGRREKKPDLLLLGLFICWRQHSEPTRSLETGIATTVREIAVWKPSCYQHKH